MKYFLTIMVLLALSVPAFAGTFIVTNPQYITVSGNVSDTLGRTRIEPDSIRIVVTDSAGTELFDDWFNSGDANCYLNGNIITYANTWNAINGGAELGIFSLLTTIASDGSGDIDLFSNQNYVVIGVDTTLNNALTAVQALGGASPPSNWADMAITVSTGEVQADVKEISTSAVAADNLETFFDNTGNQFTNFDDMYDGTGYVGGTIEFVVDISATQTFNNTGTWTGNLTGSVGSVTADVGITATAVDDIWDEDSTGHWTSPNMAFVSGQTSASGLDSTILSNILHRIVWGTAVGSGSDSSTAAQRDIGVILASLWEEVWRNIDTANVDTSLIGEWLTSVAYDNAALANSDSLATVAEMVDSVWNEDSTGHYTSPQMAFTSAQTSAGGLDSTIISNLLHRIVWGTAVGSGSDSSTVDQRDIGAILASVITSLVDDIWDEDSTGHWTSPKMAFIAGQTSASDVDSTLISNLLHRIVWGTIVATGSDSSTAAQRDIGAIIDRLITLAKFDTAAIATYYNFGIWLDDAAANTDSDVGVDGTPANPVSTLAAARILADSMGLMKYYITNNSSFTLDAAYEDWCFMGMGETNQINFGNQDVDNSNFRHLMVAGIQGGTGLIWLDECYLDAADSLECVARNSWFSDTISVRVATNIVFDQCYSAIAGNNTPGIDFNSAGGTIDVNVRHYSGGLALFNMTSNHTISYETDGQLVVDASCTSANVTARGNMTITDNGTTTALTDSAVFNRPDMAARNWDEVNTGVDHNVMSSTGKQLRTAQKAASIATGTIVRANDSTAVLTFDGGYTFPDDFFEHRQLEVDVGTDSIEVQAINSFTGATDSIALALGRSFHIVPANGDIFQIIPATGTHVIDIHAPAILQILEADTSTIDAGFGEMLKDTANYHADVSALALEASLFDPANTADSTDIAQSVQGGLETQGYTNARAENLDSLDATISGITATLPDSSAGDISYIANNQDDFKADVSGCGAGPSVANDTLFVFDASDTTVLIGVKVTVRPNGGGSAIATGTTDASGVIIFGLIDGTYDYLLFKQGTNFNAVDTIVISGTGTDSLYGTPFSPTAGPANTTAIFTWLLTSATDTLDPSWVKWMLVSNSSGSTYDDSDWITSGAGNNKILHDKNWHTVSTDMSLIAFNLIPNTDLFVNGVQDTSSHYKFKGDFNGNISVRIVQVPDQESFNPYAP